jgi:cysteine desulfuration protein SufE
MTLLDKQEEIQKIFQTCPTPEQKYQKVIELGRALPPFDPSQKIEANLVHGCQSQMYLHTLYKEGRLYFNADSEALISKGLAAILITVYQGEAPASIISSPPTFLKEIGLLQALSPGRSNGLLSLYLHMKAAASIYNKN